MSEIKKHPSKFGRAMRNGAISTAVVLGTRILSKIYRKKYLAAREKGELFFVDDQKVTPAIPDELLAVNNPAPPEGPTAQAFRFKSRLTTQGKYPPETKTLAFRKPPVSGRIIAGVGETEHRRAPRTFFHGIDTPYGALELNYPVYTSTPALDRVAGAIRKNRRAVGPVADKQTPINEPAEMAEKIKALAKDIGAVAVGCTPVTEIAVYDTVDEYLPTAIVFAHPMDRERLLQTPSPETLQGVMQGYHDVNEVCLAVSEFIRSMGWQGEANSNLGGAPETVNLVPLAVDAGIGTMGRHGSIITRTHGSNVRLSAVLTDMPLAFDSPVDFGVEDMCADCHVCQFNCPPNAIHNDKRMVRGIERWHVDMDRCLPYFLENEGCGVCITVCPWAETDKAPLVAMLREQQKKVQEYYPAPVPEEERFLTLDKTADLSPINDSFEDKENVWANLTIDKKVVHPGNIHEIFLKRANGMSLPDWSAGAHIELALPSGKFRAYSLSNLPEDGAYRLAVKVEDDGAGGSSEVSQFAVGDILRVGRPGNNYLVSVSHKKYILCAGGIGVTVMVPVAKYLASLGHDVEVHYSVKQANHAVFADELAEICGDKFTLHQNRDWLHTFLDEADDNTAVCMCGPWSYMKDVRQRALEKGIPDSSIYSEDFGSDDKDGDFDIILASSGESITIPAGESVARTLTNKGIHVPVSCGYGICGTCTVGVLDGEIDHRDRILPDDDRASKMTLCCSRAKGKTLTLDI